MNKIKILIFFIIIFFVIILLLDIFKKNKNISNYQNNKKTQKENILYNNYTSDIYDIGNIIKNINETFETGYLSDSNYKKLEIK